MTHKHHHEGDYLICPECDRRYMDWQKRCEYCGCELEEEL